MLERPSLSLNPARSIVAVRDGLRAFALWWLDREASEPLWRQEVDGHAIAGLYFASDQELWSLTSDGRLDCWDANAIVRHAEAIQRKQADDTISATLEQTQDESLGATESDDAGDAQQDEDKEGDTADGESTDDANGQTPGPAADATSAAANTPANALPPAPTPRWTVRIDADVTAFDVDGAGAIAAGAGDGRLWIVRHDGTQTRVFCTVERHADQILAIDFHPNGTEVATSGRDRVIRTWSLPSGAAADDGSVVTDSEVLEFFSVAIDEPASTPEPQATAAEAPEPQDDSAGSEDTEQAEAPQPEEDEPAPDTAPSGPRPLVIEPKRRLVGLEGWQLSLSYSPDGRSLASSGMDHGLYRWDLVAEESTPTAVQFAHAGWVVNFAWAADSTTIATASWDNTIGLFAADDLQPLVCFELHNDYVSDVEFVGEWLCASSHDREISVWKWRDRRLERVLVGHSDWVRSIQVIDDTRIVSAASDRSLRVWRLDSDVPEVVLGSRDEVFEVGAPVDLSAYVDVGGLASRQSQRRSRRYRDYRASGFRTTSDQTAMGLLEGALGPGSTPAPSTAEPAVDAFANWGPAPDDPQATIELARAVAMPTVEIERPTANDESAAAESAAADSTTAEPAADEPAVDDIEPIADEPHAAQNIEADPDVGTAAPADHVVESAERSIELEIDDEFDDEVASENRSEPGEDVDDPGEAPESSHAEPVDAAVRSDEDKADSDDDLDLVVPQRSKPTSAEREDMWRREPSIGPTTIRRMPPVGSDGETSIAGPNVVTAFEAVGEVEDVPFGLGDEPSERLDTHEPPSAPVEPLVDPPSIEMAVLGSDVEVGTAHVEDEDALEQMVAPSILRTDAWRRPASDLIATHAQSVDDAWDMELSADDLPLPGDDDDEEPPAMDASGESQEVTQEIPAERLSDLRRRQDEEPQRVDEVEDTQTRQIWERLPSRATPRGEILMRRAAPGASSFALHHKIRTPHEFVYGLSVSPDGQHIATCGGDRSVCVWSRDGELLHRVQVASDGLNAVDFSFDGRALVAGGDDAAVHMWLLPPKSAPDQPLEHAEMRGHSGWVADVCFSPDASFVLTGSYDGTARVWKLSSGQCVRTLRGHEEAVSGVTLGNTKAFTVSYDGTLRMWDQSWKCIDSRDDFGRILGVSSNGRTVALCNADGEVFIMRPGLGQERLPAHKGQARSVLVRGDGVVFTAGEEGGIRVYGGGDQQRMQSLVAPSAIWALDARSDLLAVGCDDGYAYVYVDASK